MTLILYEGDELFPFHEPSPKHSKYKGERGGE